MTFITDGKMKVGFECDTGGLFIKSIENYLSGESLSFISSSFALVVGKDRSCIICRENMAYNGIIYQVDKEIDCQWAIPDYELKVEYMYILEDFVLKLKVHISNYGKSEIFLRELIIFEADAGNEISLEGQKYDCKHGVYDFWSSECSEQIEAQPVFLDKHIFLGIDWPVAQNVIQGKQIMCRQFCAIVIKPDTVYESKAFSIGVGKIIFQMPFLLISIGCAVGKHGMQAFISIG